MASNISSRVASLKSVGKGIRLTKMITDEIVANLPENFDPNKRGAVVALVHAWACPDGNIPAVATKGGERTDYGTGVNTVVTAIKRALADESTAPDYLALAVQAATTAKNKDVEVARILAAIESALVDSDEA